MVNYTVDTVKKIYNDDNGDCVEVRPDTDALGMVEVIVGAMYIRVTKTEAMILSKVLPQVVEAMEEK